MIADDWPLSGLVLHTRGWNCGRPTSGLLGELAGLAAVGVRVPAVRRSRRNGPACRRKVVARNVPQFQWGT